MVTSVEAVAEKHVCLANLIHPLNESQFFADYYGRKPLLASVQHLAPVIALEDLVARLECLNLEFGPGFSLARDGEKLSALFVASLSKKTDWLTTLLQKNWTLICNTVHLDFYPIHSVAFQLAEAVKMPVNVNAYYTPEGARGFDFHTDKHDVFIWQQHGRKNWKVLKQGEDDESNPVIDTVLEPGQVLYIPENCRHAAVACEGAGSLHLTFGYSSRFAQAKKFLRTQVEDWMAAGMAEGLDGLVLPHNLSQPRSSIQPEETLRILESFRQRLLCRQDEPSAPEWRRVRLQRSVSPRDVSDCLAGFDGSDRFRLIEPAQVVASEDNSVALQFESDTVSFKPEFASALNVISDGYSFVIEELPLEFSKAMALGRVLIGAGVLLPTASE